MGQECSRVICTCYLGGTSGAVVSAPQPCGLLSGIMRAGIGGVLELTKAEGWLGWWTLLWSDS